MVFYRFVSTLVFFALYSCTSESNSNAESFRGDATGNLVDIGIYINDEPTTLHGELIPDEVGWSQESNGLSGDRLIGRTQTGQTSVSALNSDYFNGFFLKFKTADHSRLEAFPSRIDLIDGAWEPRGNCQLNPDDNQPQLVYIVSHDSEQEQAKQRPFCYFHETAGNGAGQIVYQKIKLSPTTQSGRLEVHAYYKWKKDPEKAPFQVSITVADLALYLPGQLLLSDIPIDETIDSSEAWEPPPATFDNSTPAERDQVLRYLDIASLVDYDDISELTTTLTTIERFILENADLYSGSNLYLLKQHAQKMTVYRDYLQAIARVNTKQTTHHLPSQIAKSIRDIEVATIMIDDYSAGSSHYAIYDQIYRRSVLNATTTHHFLEFQYAAEAGVYEPLFSFADACPQCRPDIASLIEDNQTALDAQFSKIIYGTEALPRFIYDDAALSLNVKLSLLNEKIDAIPKNTEQLLGFLWRVQEDQSPQFVAAYDDYVQTYIKEASEGVGTLLMAPHIRERTGGLKAKDDGSVNGVTFVFDHYNAITGNDVMSGIEGSKLAIQDAVSALHVEDENIEASGQTGAALDDQLGDLIRFNALAVVQDLLQFPDHVARVGEKVVKVVESDQRSKKVTNVLSYAGIAVAAVAGGILIASGIGSAAGIGLLAAAGSLVKGATAAFLVAGAIETAAMSHQAYTYHRSMDAMESAFLSGNSGAGAIKGFYDTLDAFKDARNEAILAGVLTAVDVIPFVKLFKIIGPQDIKTSLTTFKEIVASGLKQGLSAGNGKILALASHAQPQVAKELVFFLKGLGHRGKQNLEILLTDAASSCARSSCKGTLTNVISGFIDQYRLAQKQLMLQFSKIVDPGSAVKSLDDITGLVARACLVAAACDFDFRGIKNAAAYLLDSWTKNADKVETFLANHPNQQWAEKMIEQIDQFSNSINHAVDSAGSGRTFQQQAEDLNLMYNYPEQWTQRIDEISRAATEAVQNTLGQSLRARFSEILNVDPLASVENLLNVHWVKQMEYKSIDIDGLFSGSAETPEQALALLREHLEIDAYLDGDPGSLLKAAELLIEKTSDGDSLNKLNKMYEHAGWDTQSMEHVEGLFAEVRERLHEIVDTVRESDVYRYL